MDYPTKDLMNSIASGDEEKVDTLIKSGANVNFESERNNLLTFSLKQGKYNISILLLKAGVNVHFHDDISLIELSKLGYYEPVKLLLYFGANVHAMDNRALRDAVLKEKGDGFFRNEWFNKNITPNHAKVVDVLIEYGADIHVNNGELFINNFDHDIQNVLYKAINDLNENERNLINASKSGDVDTISELIKSGTNTHVQNDYAIRLASNYGHFEVVKILLENGINILNEQVNEALNIASQKGYLDIVNILLKYGINKYKIEQVFKEIVVGCNFDKYSDVIHNYISKIGQEKLFYVYGDKKKELILRLISQVELDNINNSKWLTQYIKGKYTLKDRYYHNMPLDVEHYLNKYARYYGNKCFDTECITKNSENLTLYRGMSFPTYESLRQWFNNEVVKIDDNNIVLKTNKYTSWTSKINSTEGFSSGIFGIVYSYIFTPLEYNKFWNLNRLNITECEFFVKPDTYKCKVQVIYKDNLPVTSFSYWDKKEDNVIKGGKIRSKKKSCKKKRSSKKKSCKKKKSRKKRRYNNTH
jgi:hypothetical protein